MAKEQYFRRSEDVNQKFDKLTKGCSRPCTCALLLMATAIRLVLPAQAHQFRLEPVFDLSDPEWLLPR